MRASLADGSLFAGRYRLLRRIATGGMGTVYEAEHAETGRRRALKVMHPHLFQSADMRERFQREARITAQIESEHIVDVSDAGVDEETGTPFLAMELLRGEDLASRLKGAGRMPPDEALEILRQAASALDRTHERAVVHRDLKPDNLFLTRREDGSPRVKILDFGVAKLVADGATGAATESLGTPLYMAPEQFLIGAKLGPTADVFALGMVTYALLTGEAYWRQEAKDANSSVAFALAAASGPREPPGQRAARAGVALPPAFDAWFLRATALDPAARFPSAGEAVRHLAEALGHAPVPAAGAWETRMPSAPALSTGADAGELRASSAVASGAWEPRTPSAPVPSTEAGATPGSSAGARDGAESAFERASTSTGAAMRSIAPGRRRRPAIAAAAIVAATAALAVAVGWIAIAKGPSAPDATSAPGALEAGSALSVSDTSSAGPASSAAPSSSEDPASAAAPSSSEDPASAAAPSTSEDPASPAVPSSSASPSSAPALTGSAPASPPATAPAGNAAASPPVARPGPGRAPASTAPAKPPPLFGRD